MKNARMPPPLPKSKLTETPPALAEAWRRAPKPAFWAGWEKFEARKTMRRANARIWANVLSPVCTILHPVPATTARAARPPWNISSPWREPRRRHLNSSNRIERSASSCLIARMGLSMSLDSPGGLMADNKEGNCSGRLGTLLLTIRNCLRFHIGVMAVR